MQQATLIHMDVSISTVFGYYANTSNLPLGVEVKARTNQYGITLLPQGGGVFQSNKQLACLEKISKAVQGFEISISSAQSNTLQRYLGGATFAKRLVDSKDAVAIVVASSTRVPAIDFENSTSTAGVTLAELCQSIAEQVDAAGGDGESVFTTIATALAESESITAVFQQWYNATDAVTTQRRVREVEPTVVTATFRKKAAAEAEADAAAEAEADAAAAAKGKGKKTTLLS